MSSASVCRRFSEFGAGVEALGASAMAYALASTLAAPFMVALADRFGRAPVILVSLASLCPGLYWIPVRFFSAGIHPAARLAGAFTAA